MTRWMLSSAAMAALTLLLRGALKKRLSPRALFFVWLPLALRLLCPFSAFLELAPGVSELPAAQPADAVSEITERAADAEINAPGEAPESAARGADALAVVWLCGCAAVGLWLCASRARLALRLRRSRRRVGDAGRLPVYVTGAVSSPCLLGGSIYLTPECVENAELRRCAVAHETAHYRRGDGAWTLLRCVCLVLHWWDPLVWLCAVLSRRDAECACDALALQMLGDGSRAAYCRALLSLSGGAAALAPSMSGAGELRGRMELIAHPRRGRAWAAIVMAAVLVLCAACAFTGVREADSAPLVFIKSADGDNVSVELYDMLRDAGRYANSGVALADAEWWLDGFLPEGKAKTVYIINASGDDTAPSRVETALRGRARRFVTDEEKIESQFGWTAAQRILTPDGSAVYTLFDGAVAAVLPDSLAPGSYGEGVLFGGYMLGERAYPPTESSENPAWFYSGCISVIPASFVKWENGSISGVELAMNHVDYEYLGTADGLCAPAALLHVYHSLPAAQGGDGWQSEYLCAVLAREGGECYILMLDAAQYTGQQLLDVCRNVQL